MRGNGYYFRLGRVVELKSLIFGGSVAILGILAGCILKPPTPTQSDPVEKTYNDAASLNPAGLPYSSGTLILAGTPVPIGLTRAEKDGTVTFDLTAKHVVLESEKYISDENKFQFVSLSEESFSPPISILRFPFTVGETWKWEGSANLGKNQKPATAELTSATETINLSAGVYKCIRVSVDLTVETSSGAKSKRMLKFWFQPKVGLIKREFGYSSTREPKNPGSS